MKTLFVLLFLLGSTSGFAAMDSDVEAKLGEQMHSLTGGEICNSDLPNEGSELDERPVAKGSASAVKN